MVSATSPSSYDGVPRAEYIGGHSDDAGPGGFDTQFFHDDPDGDDYALVDDGILGDDVDGAGETKPEEEDLWAGTQGKLKMARPESVHYAKKAKKVDVKRLKDNIWKGLKIEEKPVEVNKQVSSRLARVPKLDQG